MLTALFIFSFSAMIISVLQIGLILGAPWGEFAMGGKYPGRFSIKLRISAFVQLLIVWLSVLVILSRANIGLTDYSELSESAIWIVVGIFFISSVLNLITTSKKERWLGAPTAMLMTVSSLFIAVS